MVEKTEQPDMEVIAALDAWAQYWDSVAPGLGGALLRAGSALAAREAQPGDAPNAAAYELLTVIDKRLH